MKAFTITLCLLTLTVLTAPFIWWHLTEETDLQAAVISRDGLNEVGDAGGVPAWLFPHKKLDTASAENGVLQSNGLIAALDNGNSDSFSEDIWMPVKAAVEGGDTDLLMESALLTGSTEQDVRSDILSFTESSWSGWSGRWMSSLNKNDADVSAELIAQYEQIDPWNYTGAGYVFVHEGTGGIVAVPSEGEGPVLSFTDMGRERYGIEQSPRYSGWFQLIEADSSDHLAASFELNLTEAEEALLKEASIPVTSAAVQQFRRSGSTITFLSGDFSDLDAAPFTYRYTHPAFVDVIRAAVPGEPEDRFFWLTGKRLFTEAIIAAKTPDEPDDTAAALPDGMEHGGAVYSSRMNEHHMEVFRGGEWMEMPVKGVNMGMGKPGYFPGEAAITRSEYRRWFEQIGEMNANTIRIYTIHPPVFYEELAAYNHTADEPLYVMHGVWIDEEPLEETLDAFDEEIISVFEAEMKDVIDVIHGNAVIEHVPGHASGVYETDVSPYVSAWVLGIEWYPFMVENMDELYPDLPDMQGTFVYTEDASPFEIWLAERFETLITYEYDTYESVRPVSFTNWVTTDKLNHEAEPLEQEDLASVDPDTIYLSGPAEMAGQFASYHVYPYYPDFLNLEERYLKYEDHTGQPNNYAGYLDDLKSAHRLPVLIAEFGIPASRGRTHANPFGWDQGHISEQEQGEITAHLYKTIQSFDLMGGLVFSWQDEWFKRTWNTMDYDDPDRRPYWSDIQTNEQHFGLLSFDRHIIMINGDNDWQSRTVLGLSSDQVQLAAEHDETYLYLQIDGAEADDFTVYLSIREDKGVDVSGFPADFRLTLGAEEGKLEVAGDYDPFYVDYADEALDEDGSWSESLTDVFHPIRLALNKEMVRPDTGETLPFEYDETGKLLRGSADPLEDDWSSLHDYETNGTYTEVRIPWLMLNATDPGSREFLGDVWADGFDDRIAINEIGMLLEHDGSFYEPESGYSWDTWDLPQSEERLKDSYYYLQDVFKD
ncbi:hypothetical protein ACFO4L_08575 [Bacillus daqingensis]|uniref:Uncharacterized protein n=1 Tax=Bacillus daqingensis TaxID=872396 RepID=A0ABV9NTA3_9BACI